MFYAGVVPAIILLIGMLISPESPAWLISKNKNEAALRILSKLEEPVNVQFQFHLIKNELEKNKNVGWKEIFKPWLRNALIIAIGIMFFQQFVGINAVIYYSPRIFLMAGFGGNAAAITASAGIGIVNLLFTIVAIYFVDRLGRRKLFFIGMSGIILTLILLGFYFAFKTSAGEEGKWISVLLIFLYIIFFAISIGPLGWLIISEVFPLTVRGMGASVGSLAVWLFNAIVSFTFFKIIKFFSVHGSRTVVNGEDIGNPAGAFWFYALIAIIGIAWGYYFIPETKGITLEKIEEHWRKGGKPGELRGI